MTERSEIAPRKRWNRDATYEERWPRYSANAGREAEFAALGVKRWERSARYAEQAADNAEKNGDLKAAQFYRDMADAARDAADALRDYADAARDVQDHYEPVAEAADAR